MRRVFQFKKEGGCHRYRARVTRCTCRLLVIGMRMTPTPHIGFTSGAGKYCRHTFTSTKGGLGPQRNLKGAPRARPACAYAHMRAGHSRHAHIHTELDPCRPLQYNGKDKGSKGGDTESEGRHLATAAALHPARSCGAATSSTEISVQGAALVTLAPPACCRRLARHQRAAPPQPASPAAHPGPTPLARQEEWPD